MNSIMLETKKIPEITGIFEIPAFQRGYRWEKEAIRLLDDILEIDEKSDYRYCLQPVVVKQLENGKYELIDGQQRLTTLFLIFKLLKKYVPFAEINYHLTYTIRERSEDFINSISEESCTENIDFFYIKKSFMSMKEWFEKQTNPALVAFNLFKLLSERVDIIWYQVSESEDSNLLFQRLNIGKIPLTSSELVKAIFLSNIKQNTLSKERQEEISLQWDNIEKELHNDGFWYFLTNNVKGMQTRIDLILNLISTEKDNDNDKYASFFYFDKLSKEENLLNIWKKIEHSFLILKDWYNNHDLYHKIGYLVTVGLEIQQLFNLCNGKTKKEFIKLLDDEIREILKLNNDRNYGDLSYENATDYKKITNLLLFFNVESTRQNNAETQWFSFEKYKKNKWTLEHIHAQQSEGMKTVETWKEWMRLHKKSVGIVGQSMVLSGQKQQTEIDSLLLDMEDFISDSDNSNLREKFESLRLRVVEILSENMNVGYLHSISNLALLNSEDNSALNNSTFDVKRNQIIQMDKDGKFIPYCTKMVFLKYYTDSEGNQVHFWGEYDRECYIREMNNILSDYVNPIVIYTGGEE